MKNVRKIVRIDEGKCNGCGVCVPKCAEGALKVIDGKARLVSETYCDGLGACLGECPEGAITIEERSVEAFDEAEAVRHKKLEKPEPKLPCGCPSASVIAIKRDISGAVCTSPCAGSESRLTHWPVQLTLAPAGAPFLKGRDVLLCADCVPFAYAGFHEELLKDNAVLVACPKLDDFQSHQEKLNAILKASDIKSLTVAVMEVPCCSGLLHMAKQAKAASGRDIPLKAITVGIKGDIKSRG